MTFPLPIRSHSITASPSDYRGSTKLIVFAPPRIDPIATSGHVDIDVPGTNSPERLRVRIQQIQIEQVRRWLIQAGPNLSVLVADPVPVLRHRTPQRRLAPAEEVCSWI